jgi:hypothetical protein
VGTPVSVSEVFVAGGLPTITYNPREALGLEARVRDYLGQRYKMLSVSGPTKFAYYLRWAPEVREPEESAADATERAG